MSAPLLIAVQHGEHLQVLPGRLHTWERIGSDGLGDTLSLQDVPALERWLRAKAEEVIRSGKPAVGTEEPLQVEWAREGKGAETLYLTYVCGPLWSRGAVLEAAATFALDVTAAVLARGSAVGDRKWLEVAIDAIATPIVLAEPDTERIWFANRAARELSGTDFAGGSVRDQAVRRDAGFFCTDPSGAPIPADQLPGARASRGEVVDATELYWHTPSGVIAMLCFAEKVPASATVPSLLVLSFFDITHLNRVERQLRQLMAGRDEFVRLAGHELRTPLTALRLQVQSLLKKYPELSGLVAVERATARMDTLAEDMLACADVLERGIRLEPEELDMCAVVDAVIEQLEDDAKRARCSVVRAGVQHLRGRWDRARLEQVLAHLVRNAIRFGAGKPVRIECIDLEHRVSVAVADHGIGIDLADQERIFHRFGRAASSRNFAGLGLGLWMVREIVRKMDGASRVDSAPGEGATFTVELPKWA